MLEFIGIFAIVYIIIIGIGRLFGGKRSKREYYIVREYEINDEMGEELKELLDRGTERRAKPYDKLPNNVVSIKHTGHENVD